MSGHESMTHAPTGRAAAKAFHQRAEAAVADVQLGDAIVRATDRLASGRARLLDAMPDAETVRRRARDIRAGTLASLERHLARFADAAGKAGATVHWADTAAEAVQVVLGIARAESASRIVKSKSMVTEEIGLNRALEGAGLTVVETDLGEFVVQIAGDQPSHIIAPIVHWTRDEVSRLFANRLGATAAQVADIPSMTAFARAHLRREFLSADLGISGANFLVAETGSVCVVTNEGNGRLCTSAPRVHVVVAGIERVVPTLDDLGVMLRLLPLSATGQALTVYTSLITGPRRSGSEDADPDGPDVLHIVLVDNGRSRILASALAEILLCIRCGACLNACPVYRVIGGHAYGSVYSGPIGSVFTPALLGLERHGELPHASTLCGTCREVCPVGIDIPSLLLRLRAEAPTVHQAPRWLRAAITAFRHAATRPWAYRTGGRIFRALARRTARDGWIGRLPGPAGAWTRSRDFPAPARSSFTETWRRREGRP